MTVLEGRGRRLRIGGRRSPASAEGPHSVGDRQVRGR